VGLRSNAIACPYCLQFRHTIVRVLVESTYLGKCSSGTRLAWASRPHKGPSHKSLPGGVRERRKMVYAIS
jgi:hypothetical protein